MVCAGPRAIRSKFQLSSLSLETVHLLFLVPRMFHDTVSNLVDTGGRAVRCQDEYFCEPGGDVWASVGCCKAIFSQILPTNGESLASAPGEVHVTGVFIGAKLSDERFRGRETRNHSLRWRWMMCSVTPVGLSDGRSAPFKMQLVGETGCRPSEREISVLGARRGGQSLAVEQTSAICDDCPRLGRSK